MHTKIVVMNCDQKSSKSKVKKSISFIKTLTLFPIIGISKSERLRKINIKNTFLSSILRVQHLRGLVFEVITSPQILIVPMRLRYGCSFVL